MLLVWNVIRGLLYYFSIVAFVVCSVILFSGLCSDSFRLEFISTQMSACLDTVPAVTYCIIIGAAVQMLLLLKNFWSCVCANSTTQGRIFGYTVSYEFVCLSCALLVINFSNHMAGVAQFRSDSTDTEERILHYSSAVLAITSFWAVHVLITVYLRVFAHEGHKKYTSLENIYAGFTVVFFLCWVTVSSFVGTVIIEWLILINAFILQSYASHLLAKHKDNEHACNTLSRSKFINFTFLNWTMWVLVSLVFAPPWFMPWGSVKTSPEYWCFVTLFSTLVVGEIVL